MAPEGLAAVPPWGDFYLAIANEVSNTTTLYSLQLGRGAHRDCNDKDDDDDEERGRR